MPPIEARSVLAEAPGGVRVSYLITTRNRADYLERTLANVREFIEDVDELIVIDGGSTDRTAEVVAGSGGLVSRFVSEPDFGEAHAFNKGLFLARGRYLKPITDDDYFYPEAMRRLILEMEGNPAIDAIFCGGEIWRIEAGAPEFVCFRYLPENVEPTPEAIYDHTNIGLGVLIRRSALIRTGGVSGNYVSVDGDLACRLLECGCRVQYLDIDLYRWHLHPHSGFNRRREIERDKLMIDVRLGRWAAVVARSPQLMGEIAGKTPGARDRALFASMWMGGLLARFPTWRAAGPLSALLRGSMRALRPVKRLVGWVRHGRRGRPVAAGTTREWSGRLV